MTRRIVTYRWALLPACIAMVSVATSCTSPQPQTLTFEPAYPRTDASGAPIFASFEGRIANPAPGKHSDRLKVSLVLYGARQSASTYWLGVVGEQGDDRVISQGTWRISNGAAGFPEAITYQLDDKSPAALRHFWRVGEDVLLILDNQGSPRPGNSAWGMMLSRDKAPYGPRTYVMVDGKYVSGPDPQAASGQK
jgi:hypothetical protein